MRFKTFYEEYGSNTFNDPQQVAQRFIDEHHLEDGDAGSGGKITCNDFELTDKMLTFENGKWQLPVEFIEVSTEIIINAPKLQSTKGFPTQVEGLNFHKCNIQHLDDCEPGSLACYSLVLTGMPIKTLTGLWKATKGRITELWLPNTLTGSVMEIFEPGFMLETIGYTGNNQELNKLADVLNEAWQRRLSKSEATEYLFNNGLKDYI